MKKGSKLKLVWKVLWRWFEHVLCKLLNLCTQLLIIPHFIYIINTLTLEQAEEQIHVCMQAKKRFFCE